MRKSQAAIDAEREAGPKGRRREAATPMSEPREPSNTEKEVHELTNLPPPMRAVRQRERYRESSQAGDVRHVELSLV